MQEFNPSSPSNIEKLSTCEQNQINQDQNEEEILRSFISHAPVSMAMLDNALRFVQVTQQWLDDYQLTREAVLGKNHKEIFPACSAHWNTIFRRGLEGHTVSSEEDAFENNNGSVQWLRWKVIPWKTKSNQISGIIIMTEDITQSKPNKDALRIAATAFESQEAMLVTDANTVILKTNKAFFDITGFTSDEVVGKKTQIFKSGHQDDAFYSAMWNTINREGMWNGEIWNRRKNGELYLSLSTITSVKNEIGSITHYVGTQIDITAKKATDEEIRRLAFYDPLTGLPNRRLFIDRLRQATINNTHSGLDSALMFIDLDKFKVLNDSHGHDVGDLLLQQVAERLSTCLREGDTVARFGGDEFMLMLNGLSSNRQEAGLQAEIFGQKILASLSLPYNLSGIPFHTTSSIGITLMSDQNGNVIELLKRADLAMYQAKEAGRNALRFFDEKIQAAVIAHISLDEEFRHALKNDEFVLYYQPQVYNGNHISGVEALVRWHHPTRGLLTPSQFIPLAEETGLIVQLGLWSLKMSCTQLAAWEKQPGMNHLTIAVNVSVIQFQQPNYVEQVMAVIKETKANPHQLILEITESLMLEDVAKVTKKMQQLQSLGVQFSLDDFGTGYSSLSYLKQLPVNHLKIDKSFIKDVPSDQNDAAIIKAIIAFAKSLKLNIIAEGVESEEQRQFLAHNNCHTYQGYLYSGPLPLNELESLLCTIYPDSK